MSDPSGTASKTPRPPIVILAGPRTGSTLLRSLLSEDPGIINCSEVFNPELNRDAPTFWNFLDARWRAAGAPATPPHGIYPHERRAEFAAYLDDLAARYPGRRPLIDLKYRDFGAVDSILRSPDETPPALSLLMSRRAPIILLGRTNLLEQHCSQLLAIALRTWGFKKPREAEPSAPAAGGARIIVPTDDLLDWLLRLSFRERLAEFWLGPYPNVLRLKYEQILTGGNLAPAVRAALERLTCGPLQITGRPATAKAAPRLSQLVENYAEVRAALRGTPFEWFTEQEAWSADAARELAGAAPEPRPRWFRAWRR